MCLISLLFCVGLIVSTGASSDWCYTGCENTPSHWGSHAPHCNGQRQSPVNINTQYVVRKAELGTFTFHNFNSASTMKRLVNNGHTVKCELNEGVKVEVRGGGLNYDYSTLQFHFHWGRANLEHHPGSEHSVDGHRHPVEMHIVSLRKGFNISQARADPEGISVLGFFIDVRDEEDEDMPANWNIFTQFITDIPNKGDVVNVTHSISIQDLLSGVDKTKYYRYNGSLTTPTCDEAVVWTVFQQPIKISKNLIKRFPIQMTSDVYRPQQSLNDREIHASAALHPETTARPGHHWCYSDCEHYTQSHWSQIADSNCGGNRQSPININKKHVTVDPKLGPFTFTNFSNTHTMDYLINTGHAVKCVLEQGMVQVAGGGLGHKYSTLQYHFHWGHTHSAEPHRSQDPHHPSSSTSSSSSSSQDPQSSSDSGSSADGGSEHTVDSHRYDMEMHIVSMRKDLTLDQAKVNPEGFAVLGFFIEATDDEDQPMSWKNLTEHLHEIRNIDSTIAVHYNFSIDDLLGKVSRTSYYRYNGSLTTPLCNEAVVWTIFKEPIKVSKNLVDKFPHYAGYSNVFRSAQPLNGREVITTDQASPPTPLSLTLTLTSLCVLCVGIV